MWAIAGGLIAALIAGGSGVAGSVVGAKMQQDANRSQADREFTRTQRLAVYMAFIEAWDAYEEARGKAFSAVLALVDDRSPSNAQAYSEAMDAEHSKSTDVSHLITKMHLVGSVEAHQAALAMWEAMVEATHKRGGAQTKDEVLAISVNYKTAVEKARDVFFAAAQRDVAATLNS